ncbi:MAG: D-alanyl-D-alanine carboxypeptidase/D-alanyl-D-alanine-endopeptidase [bacterium]
MNKRITAALAAFFVFLMAASASAQDPTAAINESLKAHFLNGASVSIIIQDLDSGSLFYSLNPDKIFIPASNLKLVTAAAAILGLGEDFRFNTDFYLKDFASATGAANGLFVKGYGDPTLTKDFYATAKAGVDTLAAQLVRAGLRQINGEIILSGTYFPDNLRPESWEAEDINWCYATRPSALAISKNCLIVKVSGAGGKVAVSLDPPIDPAMLDIKVSLSSKARSGISISQSQSGRIAIKGTIRKGQSLEYEYPVLYPDKFFGTALSGALKRAGIVVKATMRDGGSPPVGYQLFYRAQSPDLLTVLAEMEKNSDNFVAEQMFRTLGAKRGSGGGTHASGAIAVETIMSKYKLADNNTLKVVDGSGLSRQNRLTARVLLATLSAFYNSYLKQSYLQLLAEPGAKGTLEKRLRGTPAQGRLWAKTGALSGACALSGYFQRGDGHMAAFVMIFNDYKVHSNEIRALQDKIALQMLEY